MWVRDMGRSILLHECSMSIAHKLHTEDQYKSPRQQMCGEQNVETTPHPQTSFFKEFMTNVRAILTKWFSNRFLHKLGLDLFSPEWTSSQELHFAMGPPQMQ